jgi:hypothetical protein
MKAFNKNTKINYIITFFNDKTRHVCYYKQYKYVL